MGEVIAFRRTRPQSRIATDLSPARRAAALGAKAPPAPTLPRRSAMQMPHSPTAETRPGPLWREVAGGVLRAERLRQRRTLAQVAERAGMSVQYLSELERGRKEASSEMLGAACGSLGLGLGEFATRCARVLTAASGRPSGPLLLAA